MYAAEADLPTHFSFKMDYVIDFKANGNKTELVITEYGWTQGEMLKRSIIGMNQSLIVDKKILRKTCRNVIGECSAT
ncbi:hypothetical protein P4H83_18450 [Paenibacillus favisporus]|uniref:hypothetical protein n=1 Tax=Paenibacillus TaxID=44249 RepID=UPI001C9315F8|nr:MULTISPECIES: hypothetical protein [Paenibacillus]MEC0176859.1 hypothetical protein [Paenibacillus favisporus]